MEIILRWHPENIDHSKNEFHNTLGVGHDRTSELLTMVSSAIGPDADKAKILQQLIEGGLVHDAHEMALCAMYLEHTSTKQQITGDAAAAIAQVSLKASETALSIAIGLIAKMVDEGKIDEFVEGCKKAHKEGKTKQHLGALAIFGNEGVKH